MLHHEAVRNVALETSRLVSTVAVKPCRPEFIKPLINLGTNLPPRPSITRETKIKRTKRQHMAPV